MVKLCQIREALQGQNALFNTKRLTIASASIAAN
jgi:hypothetical protein